MNNVFRKIIIYIICIMIMIGFLAAIYFKNQFANSRKIDRIDNLSGQRIGVITAYEGDYLLSDRQDITLQRYNSEADLLVALCYRQVDAAALTYDMANYVVSLSSGFKIHEQPIATNNVASMFSEGSKYMAEFEDFLQVIKENGEYDKYLERYYNNEYYDGSPITEQTGTGEIVRIGYNYNLIPIAFEDTINHCPNGSEVDIYIMFANYMNYKIEWVKEAETSGVNDLYYGKIDILLAGYSEVYREDCETSPYVDMGPSYRDSYIVLLEVEDYDNLKIGVLEEDK